MSNQFQEKPQTNTNLDMEEEEVFESIEQTKQTKYKSRMKGILIGGVAAIVALQVFGNAVHKPDLSDAPDGYLSIHSMAIYEETGAMLTDFDVRSDAQYITGYKFDGTNRHTAYYLEPGASWENFYNLYSEYTGTISLMDMDSIEINRSYTNITVYDFAENYMTSGEIDFDRYSMVVTYEGYSLGRDTYYTENEITDMYMDHYGSFFPRGSIWNPYPTHYQLTFHIRNDVDGNLQVEYFVYSQETYKY